MGICVGGMSSRMSLIGVARIKILYFKNFRGSVLLNSDPGGIFLFCILLIFI